MEPLYGSVARRDGSLTIELIAQHRRRRNPTARGGGLRASATRCSASQLNEKDLASIPYQ